MDLRTQAIHLIIIYSIVGIGIILSLLIRLGFNDSLKKMLPFIYGFNYKGCCDIWCISHIVMYILLGFFAPSLWYIILALSVTWEAFEYLTQGYIPFIVYKTSDFLTNVVALIVGILIYKLSQKFKLLKLNGANKKDENKNSI
jgi:hypothetical protein